MCLIICKRSYYRHNERNGVIMGLFKVGIDAVSGVLSDSWREYFYCDSMPSNVLMTKGVKRTGKRNSNRGDNNIISNGSIVAINEGQCMMIVEQGMVVDICAEPGEFVYDTSSEPSVFYGDLGESITKSFSVMGKRVGFAGGAANDQRVYFFNMKEIMGNKYGTPQPVPFRVVDRNIGLDVDISIRCNGEYSYKIIDPLLFYKNVSGNVSDFFTRDNIDSQLKTELMTALQPAFAKISDMGIRYSSLPGHTMELAEALNQVLSQKWKSTRGLAVASFGINSVSASEEDEDMIKQLQRNAAYRDPSMAAATIVGAQAQAMQDAAKNSSQSPFMAFAGMNMAQSAGGVNAETLFNMGKKEQKEEGWRCSCGTSGNTGKFCMNCGSARPQPAGVWTCSCGAENSGNFCMNCGSKRPAPASFKCNKCGWKPTGAVPKFCPECGDPFNEEDMG